MPNGEQEQQQQQEQQQEQGGFTAITSQADLDRIISTRLARENAKYADYDQVKQRLAEIEDKDKSELERANGALTQAQKDAADAKKEAAILRAVVKHKIPADYVDLIDGADDEAIDAKAERIAKLAGAAPTGDEQPNPSGDQQQEQQQQQSRFFDPGQSSNAAPDQTAVEEAFARQLFGIK